MSDAPRLGAGPLTEETTASRGTVVVSWLWIAGVVLASMALLLLAAVPPLPGSSADLTRWLDDCRFQLTWAGEFLFFAVIAWGSGAVGMFGRRGSGAVVRRTIALVSLHVALIAFVIVLLALGRLVYPVIDIDLSADTMSLLASVVLGSVHLALLALAVVAIAVPVPMASVRARRVALAVGVGFGVVFLVGSFPWLLPAGVNVAVAVMVGGWGSYVGVAVLSRHHRPGRTARAATG